MGSNPIRCSAKINGLLPFSTISLNTTIRNMLSFEGVPRTREDPKPLSTGQHSKGPEAKDFALGIPVLRHLWR